MAGRKSTARELQKKPIVFKNLYLYFKNHSRQENNERKNCLSCFLLTKPYDLLFKVIFKNVYNQQEQNNLQSHKII